MQVADGWWGGVGWGEEVHTASANGRKGSRNKTVLVRAPVSPTNSSSELKCCASTTYQGSFCSHPRMRGARPGVFEQAGCCKCGAEVRRGGNVVPDTSTKGVPFSRIVARDMSALEPMIPCTQRRPQLLGPSDTGPVHGDLSTMQYGPVMTVCHLLIHPP